MKSKRVLATVLSVVMLVASLPCIVLAGNETEEVEIPETQEITLDLTEGVTSEIARFDPGETKVVSFTPSSSGRYGFMCANGFDLSVSVKDQYGTAITPAETEKFNYNIITYLQLDAGMKYLFTISEYDSEDSYSDNVQLLIGKSSKTLHLGSTYVFAETHTTKEIAFTPSESGRYVFTVTSPEKVRGRVRLAQYQYADNRDYTYKSVYILADLTAGVTYPLCLYLDDYQTEYGLCNPMKITVEKGLPEMAMGRNSVKVKPDNQDTYFQFTPSEDGVYLIYSLGNHSTKFSMDGFSMEDHHYGEGDNFRTGVCLKAGKTYYPAIAQNDPSEADIDIYIQKAPEITGSQMSYSVDAYDALFYSFTPSQSGFYRYYSDNKNPYVRLTKFGEGGNWDSRGVSYFEAGAPSMIWIANDNTDKVIEDIDSDILHVEKVSNTVAVGDANIISNPNSESHVYTTFTPQTTGKYTIDILVGYARLTITGAAEGTIEDYYYTSNDEGFTDTYKLNAGETYLLDVNLSSCYGSISNVPVRISKESLPTLGTGDNIVSTQWDEDTYYTFTPEESGTYEFLYFLYPSYNAVSVQHGQDYGQGSVTLTWESCHNTIVTLEKDTEYTVGMPKDYDFLQPVETTLYIKKIAELKEGENQVDRPLAENSYMFHAEFTPEKTGIYTFTNGSSSFSTLSVYNFVPGEGFYNQLDSVYQIGRDSHFLLEAGKSYLIEMSVRDTNTTSTVLVTKDPALKVGTNSVTIPAPADPDDPYSYFSFTAPEDGHYIFKFENADLAGTALHAGLYTKTSCNFETAGYLYNGVYTVGCELRKGETYRLRVNLDPNANGEGLDIAVISAFFPESKLDGYTLSLDGAIAVNLYMTLAEKVADSDTARMNVTLPNGATKAYKMSDATPVTVDGKTYYVFRVPVAAKEMTAEIKAQIVDGEFEGTEYTFTVQDYAKFILEHPNNEPEFAAAAPLVKALLNYGAYAQTFFGYKTDALANSILKDADKVLPTVNPNSLPSYNSNLTSMPEGVTFKSVSLSLESETELNLTFTNTTGKALSFTTDNRDVKLKVTTSGDKTTLKISGIPAHKINEVINLKVFLDGDSNTYYVSYSPIYYCRNQIERPLTATRTQSLKDFMAAFYLYNQAARNYIDN